MLQRSHRQHLAFSGSSGGSLVASVLASGGNIDSSARVVIAAQPECRWRPWRMLSKVDSAVESLIPNDAHMQVSGRLRVLLTHVKWGWPPIAPLVLDTFDSTPQLRDALRASCDIPGLGGLRPKAVHLEPKGVGEAACFDGSVWPSWFCGWRAFSANDVIVAVSGLSGCLGLLGPPLLVPLHWVVLPPSQEMLWRFYRAGYQDAERCFGDLGDDVTGSELVEAVGQMLRGRRAACWTVNLNHDLLVPIALGWVQLLFTIGLFMFALRAAIS